MLGKKKIVGVCLTKIHDETLSDFVNRLHYLAQKVNVKLIFFNSFVDFVNNDSFDEGARSVYSLINYDVLDALVIVYDSFKNKDTADGIINRAQMNNIPVVAVHGEADGCWTICSEYEQSFKYIMRHVIREHNATDTYFIAGNRENDPYSEGRIRCYREVLEEMGLPFDAETMVGYGGYWEDPARLITLNLVTEREKLPQAIFCANDYMAFAVCKELSLHGYSVPRDVIVTGFDGVAEAEHFNPMLTTCREDLESLAQLTLNAVCLAVDGAEPQVMKYNYIPHISESCGCLKFSHEDYRNVASDLFHMIHDMENHEDFEYNWIDKMLDITDINGLYATLSGCMIANSYVCLNSNFVSTTVDLDGDSDSDSLFTDEMVVIPSDYSVRDTFKSAGFERKDIIPNLVNWVDDNTSYVLTSIYVGSRVCGYYAVRTDNIPHYCHQIKRVSKTINIAFTVAINYFRQLKLRQNIERSLFVNNVTDMPNLKAAVKWFDEFASHEDNRRKTLSISVYNMPKYTYILENYGMEAAEETVCLVAEAIKLANRKNCYVAHFSEDSFVVVNYYDNPNSISDTIQKSTNAFFGVVEGYNSTSGKEYYVEVNCGCVVVDGNWEGSLEGYIKYANAEMYMNRLKNGSGEVIKENKAPKEHYKAFELLISKNMFSYHFQPIVSARTGEIMAYEALMRTDKSIGMNPLEVLSIAKQYHRLYEIEKATMFNVMERYSSNPECFGGRSVFINTIPGHFLHSDDIDELVEKYGSYMDKFVYELTEQDAVSDEELNVIRRLGGETQIAIDDYGTGHSNIVNLMRYAPQIIKIDRFLITDIHKNRNKQMFVRSTIEFAKINGIKVLAEGVETSSELQMVIELGVDLVQGYYTAKPAPEPLAEIPEEIRKEIKDMTPLY